MNGNSKEIDREENQASIPKSLTLTLINMCLNESDQFNMHYTLQTHKPVNLDFG